MGRAWAGGELRTEKHDSGTGGKRSERLLWPYGCLGYRFNFTGISRRRPGCGFERRLPAFAQPLFGPKRGLAGIMKMLGEGGVGCERGKTARTADWCVHLQVMR